MSEALVLPTYNRYFNQVLAQSPLGIIAYGCRNQIYFIDARCYPPVLLDSKCILRAYREKVAALSFCKCENIELIASMSDCGEVKIWDINSGTSLNSFSGKEGISNIEWIYGSANTVVFPQDSKVFLKWNFSTNYFSKIKFGFELRTSFIASNEKCPNLLAIGHHNGTITVLDIVQEKILHRFKDHCREINILAWSPLSPETLLSVCSDYSLRTWRLGEDKSTKLFWLGRSKADDKRRARVVGICHPKDANVMICSNPYGEVGEVSLSEEKPKFKPYSKTGAEVTCRMLFGFFSGVMKTEQGPVDILYCFDNYMLTIWSITEKKLLSFLPFFMGFVYDLSFSPVNPIYMAISNGDGIMRVWNSQADSQTSRMISVFVQAKIKIMSAAWHPTWENVIAFGTDDGKIGIIDTIKKRAFYPYQSHHKGKVYCVIWGPCKISSIEDAESDEHFIYSCGGGEIYINRYKKLNEEALKFNEVATQPTETEPTSTIFSEISWKPDYSCLCVGTYKGFIDVYNEKLEFLSRCDLEMKSIEGIRWHPENTYMSPTGSPYKLWLACSGNDPTIYIVDTSKMSEEKSECSADWIVKKLIGHKKPINSIAWSPHMDGYLVSASKDGSAMVWNVCTGNIIASYLAHSEVVNTVQWSVFDEDVIYSGGQDACVRVWRISQQKTVAPAERAPYRKKLRRPKQTKAIEKSQDSGDEVEAQNGKDEPDKEDTSTENVETKVNKDSSAEIAETENADGQSVSNGKVKSLEGRQDHALWLGYSTRKSSNLFGSTFHPGSVEDDLKDCLKLADYLRKGTQEIDEGFDPLKPSEEEILSDADALKFGLYTDQTTALRMADIQADVFKQNNDVSRFSQVSIVTNKMEPLIKEAADNGTLSSYLVSLAPSVSYSFWLEMCEKYAVQLLQAQQPYVACTYFLMCNKIYEAIDVLQDKGKVIDALALARLRLPESDPVITKLLILMHRRSRSHINVIGEAKCYLSLNDVLLAVKTLGSMSEASSVKTAVCICRKYSMNEEAEKYLFIFMQRCLMQCDWESFRKFAIEEPSLQMYSILFAVHEAFYTHLRDVKKQSGIFLKEIFSLPNSKELVKFWNGTTCLDSDKSFMEYVCDVLESKNLLSVSKTSLETVIQSLDTFSSKWNTLDSATDAHVAVALNITKYILLTMVEDFSAATANFLKIFESSCNIAFLPRTVFVLFFPMSVMWSQNEKSIICQIKTHDLESSKNVVITQYQQILRCIIEKFVTKSHPLDLTIISKGDLQNNLRSVTEKIVTALSFKKVDEFVLTYFVSYIVHDLLRLADKKVLSLECRAEKTDSDLLDKVGEKVPSVPVVDEAPSESNLAKENSENDKTDNQKDESSELDDLIEAALKEADEKIEALNNTETSITSGKASHIQTKDMPDSCFNNGKSCEEDLSLCLPNDECEKVSNGEGCIQVCSSETVSNLGNDDVQISNNYHNSHDPCLASVDLFYHLMSFLVSNICKEEFTLLHYLKDRLKFLQLSRASHELNKFSKGNKVSSSKSKISPKTNGSTSSGKAKESKNKTKDHSDKSVNEVRSIAPKISQVEDFKGDGDKSDSSNSALESSKDDSNTANNGDHNLSEELSNSAVESVNLVPNDSNSDKNALSNSVTQSVDLASNEGKREFSDSTDDSPNQLHSDDSELRTIISNDHNYSSPSKDCDPDQEAPKSATKFDSGASQDSDENVLIELIHLLESEAKGFSYPSPLEIVPKVLRILYDVRQNSTCSFIQEKLHMLIHDIVHWAETFQLPNINFVCEICR